MACRSELLSVLPSGTKTFPASRTVVSVTLKEAI
jgi:hypothetical protein